MARRPTFTDRRRHMLARRVASLEAMESRSMVTEGLFSLGLGLGLHAASLVGHKHAGQGHAKAEARPAHRSHGAEAGTIPLRHARAAQAAGGGGTGHHLAATPKAAPAPAGDWLTLAPADPPSAQPATTAGGTGGGALPGGGGGGPVAGGAIAPLRTMPPPDLAGASSSIIAAAPPPGGVSPAPAASHPGGVGAPAPSSPATPPAPPVAGSRVAPAILPSGGAVLTPAAADPGIFTAPGADTNVAKGIFSHFELYTLDYNDGLVLFPGDAQAGTPGNNVDLRAQVRGVAVSSYSWDTKGLVDAINISGTSTYNLKFQWNSSTLNTNTDTTTLTVTDAGGNKETQTYTFRVRQLPGASSGGGTTTWPESLDPGLLRPDSPAFDSHNLSVDAASGAVDASIALPAYSPNIAPLVLTYDSLAADPRPIVVEHHVLDPTKAVPDQVTASLTFNSVTGSTSYYDTSGLIAGDIQQIGLQVSAAGTGRYSYTINLGDVRGGVTTSSSSSGTVSLLDESANPFGVGWTLQGLEAIDTATTGGVLLTLGGNDRTLWFSGSPGSGGGDYTSPPGDFSTLHKAGTGVTPVYTRTMPDGTVYNFDSTGHETAVVDRNGLRITFAYSSGKLTTMADPYAKVTTFAYDGSGLLQTITDPASRVATFTHDSTAKTLTTATLPDSSVTSFAYDASKRLTRLTDPNNHAVTVAYDSANRAGTVTRPDSTAETFVADQVMGFITGSSSGSPGHATLLAEARGTHTDPNGHATDVRPDWRGMGLADEVTDPDGNVAAQDRDSNGLATIAIDRLNRITTYTYSNKGLVTGLTYPDQNLATFAYNGFAEVLTARDANGHTTSYTYDGSGNNTVVEDALHDLTTMTYTGNGRLATLKDANSHTTSYQYDSQDRLTTITYPLGGATTLYAYDAKGNVATVTDERGNSTTYGYDALNRLTGIKDALANRTTYTYDSGGNLTAVQAPLSRTTSYAYDAMDRVATVTDPLSHATVLGYDSGGNLKTVTDPLSRITTFLYDPEDRRTVTTAPLGVGTTRAATVNYDAEGQVVQSADYLDRITTTVYNSRGWAATVTDPLGNVATYTYSATGQPVTQSDPSHSGGTLVSYGYDAADRLTTVTDALGHTDVTVYDSGGNVVATVDGNGDRTTYAYDARDRLTTMTDALSHNTVIAYDSGGNKTSITDPLSHATQYGFDALNRVTTFTDARSAVTTIAYDAAGRETGLTDPDGNATAWAYDAADRMTTETAPVPMGQNGVSTYMYDNAGQLTDQTDRDGRRITYAYDPGGRMINERWLDASGGTVRTITYTYDADDEVTGASDPDSLLTFTYDSGGNRLTAVTSGTAGQPTVTLTSAYDAFNERTTMTDSLASVGVTTYAYDAAHRLTTLAQSFGGVVGPRVVLGYDSGDRNTSVARSIGGGTEVDSTLAYDNANRLTTLVHQVSGGSVLASYAYAYDNADRLTTEAYTGSTVAYNYSVTYTYDAANELTAAGGSRSESYGYDSGGNRNTTGYSTITGNEMTASPGFTYTYDAQGDTTAQTETGTGKVTTFSYDYRDRLTGVTEKDSKAAIIMQATYTYDALDRRIGTDVDADGAGAGSPVQTWMVYDGQDTYADFDGKGTLLTRYLYGPAIDELLARTSSGGTSAWYLTDHLGSARDIANTSGSVIDHLAYDSFGGVASETNSGNGDRYKFAGRELDSETGNYENRARQYDPTSGRFLSQDPVGLRTDESNLYAYVDNRVTVFVDPSGMLEDNKTGSTHQSSPTNPIEVTNAGNGETEIGQKVGPPLDAITGSGTKGGDGKGGDGHVGPTGSGGVQIPKPVPPEQTILQYQQSIMHNDISELSQKDKALYRITHSAADPTYQAIWTRSVELYDKLMIEYKTGIDILKEQMATRDALVRGITPKSSTDEQNKARDAKIAVILHRKELALMQSDLYRLADAKRRGDAWAAAQINTNAQTKGKRK